MEDRLEQFKTRKKVIASQLGVNSTSVKKLCAIRHCWLKREALIRAEIEAIRTEGAEIRDRLQNLTEQMDNFKETAESKMQTLLKNKSKVRLKVLRQNIGPEKKI